MTFFFNTVFFEAWHFRQAPDAPLPTVEAGLTLYAVEGLRPYHMGNLLWGT